MISQNKINHSIMKRSTYIRALMLAIAAASLAITIPAEAADIYKLKAKVTVEKDTVTLGDLFEGVGVRHDTPVFKSPALGKEGTIRLETLIDIATRYGFTFDTPLHLKAITVTRPARTISANEIEQLIKARLSKHIKLEGSTSLKLTYTQPLKPIQVPLSYSGHFHLTDLAYDRFTKKFTVTLAPADAINAAYHKTLKGHVTRREARPVLKRDIKRGDIISNEDIEIKHFPPSRIAKSVLAKTRTIVGMTAARAMKAGSFIRTSDLDTPKLVKKNQLVMLVFEKNGMMLKTRGKAMTDGERGESISVMNIQSKRMIEGTIQSAGVVVIHDATSNGTFKKTAQLN
jgi:flagella basal body P-ring formation protein FlgA